MIQRFIQLIINAEAKQCRLIWGEGRLMKEREEQRGQPTEGAIWEDYQPNLYRGEWQVRNKYISCWFVIKCSIELFVVLIKCDGGLSYTQFDSGWFNVVKRKKWSFLITLKCSLKNEVDTHILQTNICQDHALSKWYTDNSTRKS